MAISIFLTKEKIEELCPAGAMCVLLTVLSFLSKAVHLDSDPAHLWKDAVSVSSQ